MTLVILCIPLSTRFSANLLTGPVVSNRSECFRFAGIVPMPKPSQQQDLSLLSSSKSGLVYLTANDWALIADKAIRRKFKSGESLVQEGRRTHGVFVLMQGAAVVQIPGHGPDRDIGPGEVCGEISFLDELPATANVIARDETEAYYLDRPTLLSLFELFPHLGSRFYRSLASILSRRLREVIGRQPVPPASSKKHHE